MIILGQRSLLDRPVSSTLTKLRKYQSDTDSDGLTMTYKELFLFSNAAPAILDITPRICKSFATRSILEDVAKAPIPLRSVLMVDQSYSSLSEWKGPSLLIAHLLSRSLRLSS